MMIPDGTIDIVDVAMHGCVFRVVSWSLSVRNDHSIERRESFPRTRGVFPRNLTKWENVWSALAIVF